MLNACKEILQLPSKDIINSDCLQGRVGHEGWVDRGKDPGVVPEQESQVEEE